jgi:4,5-DOPA dioxygenase extradiol
MGRMPALYLGHGAPPLVDDPLWPAELAAWSARLPRPAAILVVSAHWESAPLTLSATEPVGLVYDFWGFPQRYYHVRYDSPGAPDLAAAVRALMPERETVAEQPRRGLDHGAYVPLSVMYPAADIPVLQVSMPSLAPDRLLELGRRLAPLRDDGVLIIGSGFLTHGLPFVDFSEPAADPPGWSAEFDAWAADALARQALDELLDYARRAPALRYAHPTVEHLAPMFVTLGAALEAGERPTTEVEGYWFGLSKRSFQVV